MKQKILLNSIILKKNGLSDGRSLRRGNEYNIKKSQRISRRQWCKKNEVKMSEYQKIYRKNNRSILTIKKKEYWKKVRLEGIIIYGGKCICCGESKQEFLTLDHITGRSIKEKGITGQKFFGLLKSQGWPKDNYQLLCFNCNCAKGIYGICPHKKGD